MISLRRILVPTDYSDCSLSAFEFAVAIAGKVGAGVDVVHVWSAPFFGPSYDEATLGAGHHSLFALVRDEAHREMTEFLKKVEVPENVHVKSFVHSGEPSSALLVLAKQLTSDLIVVGTHGRTGARYLMLGSVATRLVRFAECPVLTVPPPEA